MVVGMKASAANPCCQLLNREWSDLFPLQQQVPPSTA